MVILENDSVVRIKCDFTLSTSEERVLLTCYLPFLKSDAIALYLYLINKGNTDSKFIITDDMLRELGIENAPFLVARRKLEAAGLLSTYRYENVSKVSYVYEVYDVLSATDFFKNILFTNLLEKEVGERKLNEIHNSFRVTGIESNYVDISAGFYDVYQIENNLNNYVFENGSAEELNEKATKKVDLNFNVETFKNELSKLDINEKLIALYMQKIVDKCLLFDVDEKEAATLVKANLTSQGLFMFDSFADDVKNYTSYGNGNDIEFTPSFVVGNSSLAKNVYIFESQSPKEYLSHELHDMKLPSSYLNLLERINDDYKIPYGILNVCISYTLEKCEHSLPEQYLRKVIVTVINNGVKNTSDAITYLYQRENRAIASKKRKSSKGDIKETKPTETNDNQSDTTDDVVDDALIQQILSEGF